jgi:hypothetical protein
MYTIGIIDHSKHSLNTVLDEHAEWNQASWCSHAGAKWGRTAVAKLASATTPATLGKVRKKATVMRFLNVYQAERVLCLSSLSLYTVPVWRACLAGLPVLRQSFNKCQITGRAGLQYQQSWYKSHCLGVGVVVLLNDIFSNEFPP